MKIITKGKLPKTKYECPICRTLFEYDKTDIYKKPYFDDKFKEDYKYIVFCPYCSEVLEVK